MWFSASPFEELPAHGLPSVSPHFWQFIFFLSFLYLDSCHQVGLGQPSSSRTFVLDIHFITRATLSLLSSC